MARWLPALIGVALFAIVVASALHVSEAETFVRVIEQAQPTWIGAAFILQAATYLAQGEIWRCVMRAANSPLSVNLAYRLAFVELLIDQGLPSSGLSGAVAVAGALQRRGIDEDVTTAGIVVKGSAFLLAYIAALGIGIGVLAVEGHARVSVLVAGSIFILAALGVACTAIWLSWTQAQWMRTRAHLPAWLRRTVGMIGRARPALVRNPRLIASAAGLQVTVIALDALTVWVLICSLGVDAPLGAVFTSFMTSSVLRTISIVPAGLGIFEATAILTLHDAGIAVPVALAATLLFRGLSFWLPMLPGVLLARNLLRPLQPVAIPSPTGNGA